MIWEAFEFGRRLEKQNKRKNKNNTVVVNFWGSDSCRFPTTENEKKNQTHPPAVGCGAPDSFGEVKNCFECRDDILCHRR